MIASPDAVVVIEEFEGEIGSTPDWRIKERPDGDYLVFEFSEPHDRFYRALESVLSRLPESNKFKDKTTISKRLKKPLVMVGTPEARILQKELSESLTVGRNTFGDDFLQRYTRSVTNFEQSIIGNANYVVYGRRGSGKSSLLAYAMHAVSKKKGLPHAWIAMQTYAGRSDWQAVAATFSELLNELSKYSDDSSDFSDLSRRFLQLAEMDGDVQRAVESLLPRVRVLLSIVGSHSRPVTVFVDDIHVVGDSLQPVLLGCIYSVARDNNCFIKISGIEQFTNIWDSSRRIGLEPPHDAQILKLDYNLTMPDRSQKHIVSILDAHSRFCGLPSAAYISEGSVLERLVLVAAAVPRDALSLFSQAITKSNVKAQRAVTITAVNAAASETVEEKLRDIGKDSISSSEQDIQEFLSSLRDFCVKRQGKNAFLVRIDNRSSTYRMIQSLIAFRFVHVLHEGITPHKVGERYIALMLDYGFYIGIRAAKSVKFVPDRPRALTAKELRALPIFSASAMEAMAISNEKKSRRSLAGTKKSSARSNAGTDQPVAEKAKKKTAAKGRVAKKAALDRVSSTKAVSKKVVSKNASAKKVVAKKTSVKKAVAKKTSVKKAVAKKTSVKKAVAKKTSGKKAAAKKVARSSTTRRSAVSKDR